MYTNLKKMHAKNNIPQVTDVANALTDRFYDRITNNRTNTLVITTRCLNPTGINTICYRPLILNNTNLMYYKHLKEL